MIYKRFTTLFSYLLYTKDLQKGDNELMYLPFYMTGMI